MIQQYRTNSGLFYISNNKCNSNYTIVFFPGFAQHISEKNYLFSDIRKRLEQDYNCVQFDYRGCGDSYGYLEDIDLSRFINDSLEIVSKVMTQKLIFIANGLGCFIAQRVSDLLSIDLVKCYFISKPMNLSVSDLFLNTVDSFEDKIDMTLLIPGYDYVNFTDMDKSLFYLFSDLGADFDNLHGQNINKKLIREILTLDYQKSYELYKNKKIKTKIYYGEKFISRYSIEANNKLCLEEDEIKVISGVNFYYETYQSHEFVMNDIINNLRRLYL